MPDTSPFKWRFKNVFIVGFLGALGFQFFATSMFDFFPSPLWERLALGFSLALGFASAPALYFFYDSALLKKGMGKTKKILLFCLVGFLIGNASYIVVGYGLGDVATRAFGQPVEKNIAGVKKYVWHRRAPNEYYIDTHDLSEGQIARLHIRSDEYDAARDPVRMHLYCKESVLGLQVERYDFIR